MYVNTLTGECHNLSDTTNSNVFNTKRFRKMTIQKYVGIETKYPIDCVTSEELLESLRSLDVHINTPVQINHDYIGDMLSQGYITQKEFTFLRALCHKVSGWNYIYTSSSELSNLSKSSNGYTKNTSRMIQALVEAGAIHILHKNKPFNRDMTILVSPMIAFKGGNMFKSKSLEQFYKCKEKVSV